MSWSKLAPIAKSTGRPMASASIVVNKDGVPKVSLILSASLKDAFKDRSRCDVSAGEGEHEGWLLVEFHEAGAFEVNNFVHGGGRIFTPLGPGLPAKAAANHPCQVRDQTADGFAVVLPVLAWCEEIAARAAPKRPEPPVGGSSVKPPAAPPPAGNGQLLDVAFYLKSKGYAVARLAGGRFQVDGEVMQFGQVVKLVNDQRADADLDPLPASKMQ